MVSHGTLGGQAVAHPINGIAVLAQSALDTLTNHLVVFGKQETHEKVCRDSAQEGLKDLAANPSKLMILRRSIYTHRQSPSFIMDEAHPVKESAWIGSSRSFHCPLADKPKLTK
jgi:hypothetical protein